MFRFFAKVESVFATSIRGFAPKASGGKGKAKPAVAKTAEKTSKIEAVAKIQRRIKVSPLPGKRVGLIGSKMGMTQTWNTWGERIPLTAIQLHDNQVTCVRTKEKDGYVALQVGAFPINSPDKVSKPVLGQFLASGLPLKRELIEFNVSENAVLPLGTKLDATHFVAGQYVDVSAKTIGKGFQGVMKKHGMKGMRATHGVTLTHRRMGGTGGGQDPGRVWPGKRMAGRMGNKVRWQYGLQLYKVDPRWNVLYVLGSVPGHKNTIVRIVDGRFKHSAEVPPFPTSTAETAVKEVTVAKPLPYDPKYKKPV